MKRATYRAFFLASIFALALALSSCDPMYRFKFTRFAFVSDMLAGNPTKVDRVKEGDLDTVVGTRDGISVKPVSGRNMNNHIAIKVLVTNNTGEPLVLDPADITIDSTDAPLNWIGKVSGGSRCQEPSVAVEPATEEDGIFVIEPGTEAIVDVYYGLFGRAKCWFEIKLKPQSSEDKITFRFKGVPDGPVV